MIQKAIRNGCFFYASWVCFSCKTISLGVSFRVPYVFLCLLLLLGCSGEKTGQEGPASASEEFRSYEIDVDAPRVPLADMIEQVEVLGLEETEASLLSYLSNISSIEDQLIFASGAKGEIFVYSNTGQFIRKFTHMGEGPEEYSTLMISWMKADTILVFDYPKQKMLYYSLEGEFLKSTRFDVSATHVRNDGNDFVMENSYLPLKDTVQHRLMVYDNQGKRKGLHIPYHKALTIPIYSSTSAFKPYGDMLIFQPAFHDTIYSIKGDEIRPLYHIDFGDRYFWADESVYEDNQRAMALVYEREQVWLFSTFPGTDQILIFFDPGTGGLYEGVIDRQTGIYQRLDKRRTAEKDFLLHVSHAEGDRFLFKLPSDELAEFIEKVGADKVNYREGSSLEKIESSENPVILWLRFKL